MTNGSMKYIEHETFSLVNCWRHGNYCSGLQKTVLTYCRRCWHSFSLLCSSIMCLRGAQSALHYPARAIHCSNIDLSLRNSTILFVCLFVFFILNCTCISFFPMNVLSALIIMLSIALAMFLGRNRKTSAYWVRKTIARSRAPDSDHVRKGGEETNKIYVWAPWLAIHDRPNTFARTRKVVPRVIHRGDEGG